MAPADSSPRTVISLNIQGLCPRKRKRKPKVQMLEEIADTEQAMIISITETHLNEEKRDSEIAIKKYVAFRTDRSQDRQQGGVITYIHDDIVGITNILLSESNSFVEYQMLHITRLNLILITIYRPPGCPTELFTTPLRKIKDKIEELAAPLPNIIMTGDLNFPNMNWELENIQGGSTASQIQGQACLELINQFCLEQCISVPTRGKNILDVFLTNNDELVQEYSVTTTPLSDHDMITVTTNIGPNLENEARNEGKEANFKDLNFFSDKVKWNSIKQELQETNWEELMRHDDPTKCYEVLIKRTLDISTKHVPKRKKNKKFKYPPR